MAKSLFETLNLGGAALRTKRVGNFIADAKAHSEMLVKQKEMQVRQLENEMERVRDLGDGNTQDIAIRVGNANPMDTVRRLHELNLEIKIAREELAAMRAYHSELFPDGEVMVPAAEA